jgi:hypothetical protein
MSSNGILKKTMKGTPFPFPFRFYKSETIKKIDGRPNKTNSYNTST